MVLLGHSLGSAVGRRRRRAPVRCRPASAATLILEGAFTSLPDTAASYFPRLPSSPGGSARTWFRASLPRARLRRQGCDASPRCSRCTATPTASSTFRSAAPLPRRTGGRGGRNALPTQAWPREDWRLDERISPRRGGFRETALDTLLRAGDPAAAPRSSPPPPTCRSRRPPRPFAATAGRRRRARGALGRLIDAPPPPAPKLIPGLRSLLADTACDAPCRERAEDWFEQALNNRGVASIQDVVRLGYADELVGAMAAPAAADEIRRRGSLGSIRRWRRCTTSCETITSSLHAKKNGNTRPPIAL